VKKTQCSAQHLVDKREVQNMVHSMYDIKTKLLLWLAKNHQSHCCWRKLKMWYKERTVFQHNAWKTVVTTWTATVCCYKKSALYFNLSKKKLETPWKMPFMLYVPSPWIHVGIFLECLFLIHCWNIFGKVIISKSLNRRIILCKMDLEEIGSDMDLTVPKSYQSAIFTFF
jgi:hypothetical protein